MAVEATAWETPLKRLQRAIWPAAIIVAVAFLVRENLNWDWCKFLHRPPAAIDELGDAAEAAAGLNQLGAFVAESIARFWGANEWAFPALCFLLLGLSRLRAIRRICDGAIIAWVTWVICNETTRSVSWMAVFVVPVIGVWVWLAFLGTREKERQALRLLIPGAFVIVVGSLCSLMNHGVFVVQLGGWWANFISGCLFYAVWLCAWACAPFVSSDVRTCWRVVHFVVAGIVTFLLTHVSVLGSFWMVLGPDNDPLIEVKGLSAVVYLVLFFGLLLIYAAIAFGILTMKEPWNAPVSRRVRANSNA